jgi:hypothetical protein
MPRGFIPDTGKPRLANREGQRPQYYLLPQVRAKFWAETITLKIEHIDYDWENKEKIHRRKTEPTIEINSVFLDATFDQLPDDAKQLMDITDCLKTDFEGNREGFHSIMGSQGGYASYEFKPLASRYGTLDIFYNWSSSDEGCVYEEDSEIYSVPGVLLDNYKYYGITREFLEWCRTPDKPKRAKWLSQLTYSE